MSFIKSIVLPLVAALALALPLPAEAAKLSPVSRGQANDLIAQCRATPGHFIMRWWNKSACCTEDANLRHTCVVCDDQENCKLYEEFRRFNALINLVNEDVQVVSPVEPGASTPANPFASGDAFGDVPFFDR